MITEKSGIGWLRRATRTGEEVNQGEVRKERRPLRLYRPNEPDAQKPPSLLLTDRFKVAVYFHLDEETLLERHRRRSDKAAHIPEAAVLVNHRKAEEPTEEEGFDLIVNYYVEGHKESLLSKCYTVKRGVRRARVYWILEFAMKMELEARDFYRESGERVARMT